MPLLIPDSQYSSYYPQYHQPLQMLLGKPLYLEVRLLNTPDPSLVLLVHYCVAYPRSGKAVWLLLYNGSASKHLSKENQEKKITIQIIEILKFFSLSHKDERNILYCFLTWLVPLMSLPRCPNPLDPAPQQTVLFDPRPPSPQGQTRRFTISTFQFLPDGELKNSDEEVRICRHL